MTAALMSARHGWLRFQSTGATLPVDLRVDPIPWQAAVLADHRRWYGPADVPTQVSGAFVLQYLLQVPAHTAASAAGVGVRVRDLAALTFELGTGGVPRLVELGALDPVVDLPLGSALVQAEADYLEVAEPLARSYTSTRRMSSQQRLAMVRDMWAEAARGVRVRAGEFTLAEPRRTSCCLIYCLPGCVECAGCPRLTQR